MAQWRPPRRYQDLGSSAFWLAAAHGLRHEAPKLLRLPRVGLHLCLGKVALQSQDVLQVLSFGQLAALEESGSPVFQALSPPSWATSRLPFEPLETSVSMGSKPFAT